MTKEDAYRHADMELEKYNFELSRQLFRDAALLSEPNQSQLGNLSLAEDEEIIHFRRELCRCYPDSFVCKISLIQNLHNGRHSGLAVLRASEALKENQLNEKEEFVVRLLRLKSSLDSRSIAVHFIEDFVYIWSAGSNNRGAYLCRRGVLKSICSCSIASFIEVFEELISLPFLSERVLSLITHKIAGLRDLQECWQKDFKKEV